MLVLEYKLVNKKTKIFVTMFESTINRDVIKLKKPLW